MDSFTLSVMYQTAVCGGGNSAKSQGPEAETPRGRNATYLKVLAYGYDTLTVNEKNYIETLALACPFVEGTAVLKARMLYAHFNPAMDYNNLVICNNAGVFKNGKGLFDDEDSLLNNLSGVKNIESKKILAENEMIIYPNPFNSEFLINYRLVQNGTIQWQLFDVLGREIYSTILDKNVQTKKIQLPYLSIGSYYYKTMVDGSMINTGKLIKY